MTRKFSSAAIAIVAMLALTGCEQLDAIQGMTSGWFSSKKKSGL